MSDGINISINEIVEGEKQLEQPVLIENIFYMTPGLTVIQATVLIKYLMKEVAEKIGHETDTTKDKQYL